MRLPIIYAFLLFSNILFSQQNIKIDTLITSKKSETYYLTPSWTVGKTDTFIYTQNELWIEDGDTLKNKSITSKLLHQVVSMTDTSIEQIAWIGKEIYQAQVFSKDMIPKNPRIKDFYKVQYYTNRKGTDIKILNCGEIQNHLIPDLKDVLELGQKMGENQDFVNFCTDRIKRMEDCESVKTFLTNDLVMFHQMYDQLVPKKGFLDLKLKTIDTLNPKNEIIIFFKISVKNKPNGNKIFTLFEDKDKGITMMQQLNDKLKDVIKDDESWGKEDDEDFKNDEESTIIELDKYNYPIQVLRLINPKQKNKKGKNIDFYEYKIEKKQN